MSARYCHGEETFTYEVDSKDVPTAMEEVAKIMKINRFTILYGFHINYGPMDGPLDELMRSVKVVAVLG